MDNFFVVVYYLMDFLKLIIDKDGTLAINLEDEIVKACLMCQGGTLLRV